MAGAAGVVRQHIDQLVQRGVVEKRPDGLFDQDVSRWKYLMHLRDERRKSPRLLPTQIYLRHAQNGCGSRSLNTRKSTYWQLKPLRFWSRRSG